MIDPVGSITRGVISGPRHQRDVVEPPASFAMRRRTRVGAVPATQTSGRPDVAESGPPSSNVPIVRHSRPSSRPRPGCRRSTATSRTPAREASAAASERGQPVATRPPCRPSSGTGGTSREALTGADDAAGAGHRRETSPRSRARWSPPSAGGALAIIDGLDRRQAVLARRPRWGPAPAGLDGTGRPATRTRAARRSGQGEGRTLRTRVCLERLVPHGETKSLPAGRTR
jgi:hypothetical protein